MEALTIARKRYWKILEETGDYVSWESEGGKDGVMNASLDYLLHEAACWADNHDNGDDDDYERKAAAKYRRFINRFSN